MSSLWRLRPKCVEAGRVARQGSTILGISCCAMLAWAARHPAFAPLAQNRYGRPHAGRVKHMVGQRSPDKSPRPRQNRLEGLHRRLRTRSPQDGLAPMRTVRHDLLVEDLEDDDDEDLD